MPMLRWTSIVLAYLMPVFVHAQALAPSLSVRGCDFQGVVAPQLPTGSAGGAILSHPHFLYVYNPGPHQPKEIRAIYPGPDGSWGTRAGRPLADDPEQTVFVLPAPAQGSKNIWVAPELKVNGNTLAFIYRNYGNFEWKVMLIDAGADNRFDASDRRQVLTTWHTSQNVAGSPHVDESGIVSWFLKFPNWEMEWCNFKASSGQAHSCWSPQPHTQKTNMGYTGDVWIEPGFSHASVDYSGRNLPSFYFTSFAEDEPVRNTQILATLSTPLWPQRIPLTGGEETPFARDVNPITDANGPFVLMMARDGNMRSTFPTFIRLGLMLPLKGPIPDFRELPPVTLPRQWQTSFATSTHVDSAAKISGVPGTSSHGVKPRWIGFMRERVFEQKYPVKRIYRDKAAYIRNYPEVMAAGVCDDSKYRDGTCNEIFLPHSTGALSVYPSHDSVVYTIPMEKTGARITKRQVLGSRCWDRVKY